MRFLDLFSAKLLLGLEAGCGQQTNSGIYDAIGSINPLTGLSSSCTVLTYVYYILGLISTFACQCRFKHALQIDIMFLTFESSKDLFVIRLYAMYDRNKTILGLSLVPVLGRLGLLLVSLLPCHFRVDDELVTSF